MHDELLGREILFTIEAARVKLSVGCPEKEKSTVCDFHNEGGHVGAILLK